jgi:GAF domain-containing protein
MGREQRLAETLVELADTLAEDFDIVDLLHTLVERCQELLVSVAAGIMISDKAGVLHVMASSTDRGRLLELFELQNQEGPCLDCHRSGEAVVEGSLDAAPARWPRFSPEARAAGFQSVHALPMRRRTQVIGALNLFRYETGAMETTDVAYAQTMADVATISILRERVVREGKLQTEQLQRALTSRVIIEQAKGMLAERGRLSMDAAFAVLRAYSRTNRVHLSEAARLVVNGRLTLDELQMGHARPRTTRE